MDYPVGEVLQRQPEPVRTVLLHTSILSRLNGSLCDAVTGQGGGRAMLEEADRVYAGDYSPDVRPVAALRARVHVAQGKMADALAWAHDRHLSPTDTLSYLHEFEHITLARILLAQHTTERADGPRDEATRLLERLRAEAKEGHRTGTVIEVLVLQALDDHARADIPAALAALEQALMLAEPEGYVRSSSTRAHP
ncbi:MAG: hypothetical protein M3065_10570 [Actinomycetota bacterium]|nr:hypothetical protein [Actinomycetota bacterium]